MKILYFGGQKSGKSLLAEKKALSLDKKPYYIATYDNSFGDKEMLSRINKHQKQRKNLFLTIESPKDFSMIKEGKTYLIDCLSMWLLNLIDDEKEIKKQLDFLESVDANIVFVLNDVNSGVIPMDKLSRRYVDLSGEVGQRVAGFCDEVYEVKLGLEIQLK